MRAHTARWSVARGIAAALPLALATAACTTATTSRYKTLAEDWHSAAPAPPVGRDDRLFEGASQLERRELVRLVLERNPTVRSARYAWRAALERYPQATALEDPMLGVGVAPLSIGSSSVDAAPKFDLSQKLPFPGKLRLRGEVALGEAEAASHDFEAVRLRLATMASLLLDDYYLAVRSLEINADHVALLEEFKRIAAARYEAGEASQQDPIQAEVQLTHALHRDVVLGTAMRVTAEQLNALLHRLPNAALPPPPQQLTTSADALDEVELLLDQALADKPELAAAAARVEAETSRLDLAKREYFPDFTLTGSYNRLWQNQDLQPFVGVALNVPLQLGRRRAAVAEADARLEAARNQQLAIRDDVRLAVRTGAERLAEARHVEQLYRERLIPAASDQVQAARSGFETGRNSFLALIDAQRNLLTAELGYEETIANLGRRRAELDRALGRIPGESW